MPIISKIKTPNNTIYDLGADWTNIKRRPVNMPTTFMIQEGIVSAVLGGMVDSVWDNFTDLQRINRLGVASQILKPGDEIPIGRVVSGSVTSSVALHFYLLNTATFVNHIGFLEPTYVFKYESVNGTYQWTYEGEVLTKPSTYSGSVLAYYGITNVSSPSNNEQITISLTIENIITEVLGIDEDVPSDPSLKHVITLGMKDAPFKLTYDAPEFLFYVNPSTYPDGLAAGTYNITLKNGDYDGGSTTDGTYQFTTTQTIPAGGGIRHTTIGDINITGQSGITNGTFVTYSNANNRLTTIETNITTTVGTSGTNLGITSNDRTDNTYHSNVNLNWTNRQNHGSDNWATSWLKQLETLLITGDTSSFTWEPQTNFDRPAMNIPSIGSVLILDPEFIKVVGRVRKRTAKDRIDGGGSEVLDELVSLLSLTEIGLGANNYISETGVKWDGTSLGQPYSRYANATASDRIKHYLNQPYQYWLRSPFVSQYYSDRVYIITSNGSINTTYSDNNDVVIAPCVFIV